MSASPLALAHAAVRAGPWRSGNRPAPAATVSVALAITRARRKALVWRGRSGSTLRSPPSRSTMLCQSSVSSSESCIIRCLNHNAVLHRKLYFSAYARKRASRRAPTKPCLDFRMCGNDEPTSPSCGLVGRPLRAIPCRFHGNCISNRPILISLGPLAGPSARMSASTITTGSKISPDGGGTPACR